MMEKQHLNVASVRIGRPVRLIVEWINWAYETLQKEVAIKSIELAYDERWDDLENDEIVMNIEPYDTKFSNLDCITEMENFETKGSAEIVQYMLGLVAMTGSYAVNIKCEFGDVFTFEIEPKLNPNPWNRNVGGPTKFSYTVKKFMTPNDETMEYCITEAMYRFLNMNETVENVIWNTMDGFMKDVDDLQVEIVVHPQFEKQQIHPDRADEYEQVDKVKFLSSFASRT